MFVTYAGNLYIVLELAQTDLKTLMTRREAEFTVPMIRVSCPCGVLACHSSSKPAFPLLHWIFQEFLRQLLEGIRICHVHQVIHRDLKPQNVLVSRDGRLQIADFGLARALALPTRKDLTQQVVTLWYRAPELLLGETRYSYAVDIWAAGVIMAELVLKRPLLPGDSEIDQLHKTFQVGCGFPSPSI